MVISSWFPTRGHQHLDKPTESVAVVWRVFVFGNQYSLDRLPQCPESRIALILEILVEDIQQAQGIGIDYVLPCRFGIAVAENGDCLEETFIYLLDEVFPPLAVYDVS